MNRKLHASLYLAALIALAPTTNATPLNNDCFPCNGFYVGINAGTAFTTGEISDDTAITYANLSGPNQFASAQNVDVANTNGGGSIYAGYGQMLSCSKFHLSGEIFANTFKRESILNHYAVQIDPNLAVDSAALADEVKACLKNGEYGLDLKPGFFLTPRILAYGRVGVAFNKLTLTSHSNFAFTDLAATPSPLITPSTLSQSANKNVSALRLGLGLESYICQNLALTADYIYSRYDSISLAGQGNVTTAIGVPDSDPTVIVTPNGLHNHASADLNTQTVTLGIKYYFG